MTGKCEHPDWKRSGDRFVCTACGIANTLLTRDDRRWYLLKVDSKRWRELLVETGGWTPMMAKYVKPKNKHKHERIEVPVFPTWIVMEFPGTWYYDHRMLKGAKGVARREKRQPMLLGINDLENLRDMERRLLAYNPMKTPKSPDGLKVGDRVVIEGLLEGVEGTVLAIERGKVSVNIGGNVPLTVERCIVRMIGL